MNIAIIVVLLLLLGSKGLGSGASCSRGRKDGKVYWLGFCDQRLGGSCIDWDFRVAVQRRIEITYRSHTWATMATTIRQDSRVFRGSCTTRETKGFLEELCGDSI